MSDARDQQNDVHDHSGPPGLGIRRWGDGCFHEVEEEIPQGYIVNGVLIPRDEVIQVIDLASGRLLLDRAGPPAHNQ